MVECMTSTRSTLSADDLNNIARRVMAAWDKPDWKKGDLIAMPADLSPGAVAYGCFVFVAEHDPVIWPEGGPGWLYGRRSCGELRRATAADCDRLIGIYADEVHRSAVQLKQMTEFRKQFFG